MTPGPPQRPEAPVRIVPVACAIYLPMLASGVLVRPPDAFRIGASLPLAQAMAAAVVIGVATVLASRWMAHRTGWGRALRAEFHALLGGLDSPRILVLSLLSAGGEEVLFRGVLQPRLGLLAASILFALLHFPVRRTLLPWTGFAFVLGLVMGGLTAWSGNLWPAIVLHFLVNYFNLHDLAERPPDEPRQ